MITLTCQLPRHTRNRNEHPRADSNAVAELVIAMLLFRCRNRFNGKAGSELRGKTIGLYAYGNVARCLAQIAKGFGMTVMAYRRRGINEEGIIAANSPAELFEKCDIVSLHMPLTPETERWSTTTLSAK